jgi:hypothetical protein
LDNQGNFLQQLPITLNQKISFWKDDITYLKGDELVLLNLKNKNTTAFSIPENIQAKNVVVDGNSVILYSQDKIWVFPKNQTPLKDK